MSTVPRLRYLLVLVLLLPMTACDRGASEEIGAARQFADAVVRNQAARRDSMIATFKFKEYFQNTYVASDMQTWLRSIYDLHGQNFQGTPSADVDRNLESDLNGALIDTAQIEVTGMVKVKSPHPGEDAAFFWMVKQHNRPWRVAMVTKGESQVNFR
jgi:hypothetical protein